MILAINIFIIAFLVYVAVLSYRAFKGKASWGQLRRIGVPFSIFLWIQIIFALVLASDAFAIISYIIDLPIWVDLTISVGLLLIVLYIYFKLLKRETFKASAFVPLVLIPLSVPGLGYIGKSVKTGAITMSETPIIKFTKDTARETTPAFRQGDDPSIKTVILLSAPGKFEEKAGRPAAGETGKTLQSIIKKLHAKDPQSFPSSRLDDYTIANADETIHYKAKTGRTEATKKEINDPANIERIQGILKNQKTVIALGKNAQNVVQASKFDGKVLTAPHPSKQALNRQYKSDKGTASERNEDRISQWFNDLLN